MYLLEFNEENIFATGYDKNECDPLKLKEKKRNQISFTPAQGKLKIYFLFDIEH